MGDPERDARQRVRDHCGSQRPPSGRLREYFAPGRINLLGDHIDYLGGTVLPMTLERGTWVGVLPREVPGIRVQALDLGEVEVFRRPEQWAATADWRDYLAGILMTDQRERQAAPDPDAGLELVVSGDLAGGGLSSSASLTVAVSLALMDAGIIERRRGMPLARFARRVETDVVGTACGLMDQAAIVGGSDSAALELDCGSLEMAERPLPGPDWMLLAVHSGVDRRLADGVYNQRRRELAAGLTELGLDPQRIPDLAPDAVPASSAALRRVRHVVTEQALVRRAVSAAGRGDWAAFGAAMSASHASLRDDFEVSIAELDRMQAAVVAVDGCLGARLTGAGFGGWAIMLLERAALQPVLAAAAAGLGCAVADLSTFEARPGGAARRVESAPECAP